MRERKREGEKEMREKEIEEIQKRKVEGTEEKEEEKREKKRGEKGGEWETAEKKRGEREKLKRKDGWLTAGAFVYSKCNKNIKIKLKENRQKNKGIEKREKDK